MVDKKTDVLVPLQVEEENLVPYPKSEYNVVVENTLDKFNRKVNQMIEQGWMPTGGVQVVVTNTGSRYYQAMERWNVDLGEQLKDTLDIPGLEDEPDLYEDVEPDADR